MTTHADRIEAVLAEHGYLLNVTRGGICLCGFVPTVIPESLASNQDYHRAHVAAILAALTPEPVAGGMSDLRALRAAAISAVDLLDADMPDAATNLLIRAVRQTEATAARAVPVPAELEGGAPA